MAKYNTRNPIGLFILLLSCRFFCVVCDPSDVNLPRTASLTSRTVRTKYGDVSGVIVTLDSKHLEPVEVFRGIPYASPPLGSLRFMPPVTGALWPGVKIADKFSPVCPQRLPDIFNETAALKRMPKGRLEYLKRLLPYLKNQSEDCLYLNIYAPAQGKKGPLQYRTCLLSELINFYFCFYYLSVEGDVGSFDSNNKESYHLCYTVAEYLK